MAIPTSKTVPPVTATAIRRAVLYPKGLAWCTRAFLSHPRNAVLSDALCWPHEDSGAHYILARVFWRCAQVGASKAFPASAAGLRPHALRSAPPDLRCA